MNVAFELKGITPLVQHNVRLADKGDFFAKEIAKLTKKRKRTEEDDQEIAHLEFLGGLYHDPDMGVHVPTWNVIRALEDAAKITRQGADVIRALSVLSDKAKVEYDGPRAPEQLWADPLFRFRKIVGVQRSKVMRVRPIFRKWSLLVEADLLEDVLDYTALEQIAAIAGRSVGLCDARKLGYGRFVPVLVREEDRKT